jgi:hypothetical protein
MTDIHTEQEDEYTTLRDKLRENLHDLNLLKLVLQLPLNKELEIGLNTFLQNDLNDTLAALKKLKEPHKEQKSPLTIVKMEERMKKELKGEKYE